MRSSGPRLLAFAAALVVADAAWLAAPAPSARDRAFVRATRGAGIGAAVSPAWSFFDVDPRGERTCESELFPVPGLTCPDPNHGRGIVDFPARSPR
jgi:hypothetical protein